MFYYYLCIMGYTTEFEGRFDLDRELSEEMFNFLKSFNETRRMKRKISDEFGVEGEFFVKGGGDFGQGREDNIIEYNEPPSTQPGLWCQWTPTEDRKGIEWDGGEKFYDYTEWLVYLVNKILAPNGYVLNGAVQWEGEERGDRGKIIVENNKVYTKKGRLKDEITPKNARKYIAGEGWKYDFMLAETVLKLS